MGGAGGGDVGGGPVSAATLCKWSCRSWSLSILSLSCRSTMETLTAHAPRAPTIAAVVVMATTSTAARPGSSLEENFG